MIPESVRLIYFSPTGTTRAIATQIAKGLKAGQVSHLNLTLPPAEDTVSPLPEADLAVIGVPVYGGRVPPLAAERLAPVIGAGMPAIVVALYGNRAYEDALVELRDMAVTAGFKPVAAGAFIGEHSYSTADTPIAPDRPDAADLAKAEAFGAQVREALDVMTVEAAAAALQVPGQHPYKERRPRQVEAPITQKELCTLCGTCATVCPTQVITVAEEVETRVEGCIACCACIKNCPTAARVFTSATIGQITQWLNQNCQARKEPDIFIPAV